MYTLTIQDSNNETANQFSFDHGSYTIGRYEACDIVLPSSSVSRKHARIYIENDRCFIEDLGSANGILVDGQRVVRARDLGTASQIRIGEFYLFLEFRGAAPGRKSVLDTLFISANSDHHKLVRVNDNFTGEEFSLSEVENTIGRTDDNFILLSDASISRRHAKIIRNADQYSVLDLGSSNGTRINGKKINGARPLQEGDLVRFGDIEFVFLAGQNTVDADAYAQSRARGLNPTIVLSLSAVAIVVGLAAVALFGKSGEVTQEANPVEVTTPTLESRAQDGIESARRMMQRREWLSASLTLDEVIALDPKNSEAISLKAQAQREQQAQKLVARGEEFSEQGRHEDARAVLAKIPRDSVAYQRAKPTLDHVRKTLAHTEKTDAIRLLKRDRQNIESLKEAHDKLKRSLELLPNDQESLDLVGEVEEKLRKRRASFDRYVAP